MSNAVRFTIVGIITISINRDSENLVIISVEDQGIGMVLKIFKIVSRGNSKALRIIKRTHTIKDFVKLSRVWIGTLHIKSYK